jgi:hypothetical protein
VLQWLEGELERVYVLSKARSMEDDRDAVAHAPRKAQAKTDDEALQLQIAVAPAYLRGRVEKGELLPVVEVGGGTGATAEEEGRKREREEPQGRAQSRALVEEVARHVVTAMKEDPCIVLLQLMRYR